MKIITMYNLTCLRCGGSWVSKTQTPTRCGRVGCRSPYWNRPRKNHFLRPKKKGGAR